jgi:hypothetical protein
MTLFLPACPYLLLIATSEFFRHLPYFRFSLPCVAGVAFPVITFLIRQ